MQLAFVRTRSQAGLLAPEATVEVHLGSGLPGFQIVGFSESATRGIRGRVRSAILSCHLKWPDFNITVNLAPAEQPKEGPRYDLPIALGLLVASQQLPEGSVVGREFFGELGLDGGLHPFRGCLAAALAATHAERECGIALEGAAEIAALTKGRVIAAPDLLSLCAQLKAQSPEYVPCPPVSNPEPVAYPDLSALRGQPLACKALEVAATGGHHLLMTGPPGVGKTLAASVLPGLLPSMHEKTAQELRLVQDAAGLTPCNARPFRAPHHSSSVASLMGGTANALPGEIALAHGGVLFLDELAEFPHAVLNQLRQPLETGHILVNRARYQHQYPAQFQLVAAMNPCPCGLAGDPDRQCLCTPDRIRRYRRSVSGPLLDRIDLHVTLQRPSPEWVLSSRSDPKTCSSGLRNRVAQLQQRQTKRQGCLNRDLVGEQLIDVCSLNSETESWFIAVVTKLSLSARSAHRRLRVARTLADMAGDEVVSTRHLETALSFREAPLEDAGIPQRLESTM
jgi:magnesium chelatase family protein